jgi:dephospho-CoA kinase
MRERVADDSVRAFVWDSPLLIEAGLHTQCDALIFIDTPHEIRLQRVRETRGWDAAELDRREKSQLPLQSKRQLAGEVVRGNAEEATLRRDLLAILERAVTSVADHNPGN